MVQLKLSKSNKKRTPEAVCVSIKVLKGKMDSSPLLWQACCALTPQGRLLVALEYHILKKTHVWMHLEHRNYFIIFYCQKK